MLEYLYGFPSPFGKVTYSVIVARFPCVFCRESPGLYPINSQGYGGKKPINHHYDSRHKGMHINSIGNVQNQKGMAFLTLPSTFSKIQQQRRKKIKKENKRKQKTQSKKLSVGTHIVFQSE